MNKSVALSCESVTKRFRVRRSRRASNGKPSTEVLPQPNGVPAWWWQRRSTAVAAVQRVSFQVQAGETFGILGANGCGKSTLIRLVATLLVPDEGRIAIFGHDAVREATAVRRLIHRVSVDAAFFKKLSAWENLTFASGLYGLGHREVRSRGTEVLERLGFSLSKLYEPLENLSRGMQQKVAITRAMLVQPALLLLDEPTTGLDPRSRRQVQAYVQEIRRNEGVTTILTTHDMQEAERLCQRVAIMRNGEIVEVGTPSELIQRVAGGVENPTLEEVFLKIAEEEEGEEEE